MTAITAEIPLPQAIRTRTVLLERLRLMPLVVILAVQAWLSGRLTTSVITFDEARYIYAGHQLIYELWHGGGSPYYENYFSGAPAIFCPLAAMADFVGGIVAVRLMSLAFMLAATVVLFAVVRRLFGYWAGCAATALFSCLSLTHFVGTYANYDSMALLLLAVAAYFAVRTGQREPYAARWLLLVPLTLFAANATKYMTIAFDPIVIGLAVAQAAAGGLRHAVRRAAALGLAVLVLAGMVTYLAGTSYWKGIAFTTLARRPGANIILGATYAPASQVIAQSWQWIGVVIALAVLALALACAERDWCRLLTVGVALLGGLLITVGAIRLHSNESMNQHDDFSAWFACIAAGYALSALPRLIPVRALKYACAAGGVWLIVLTGIHYNAVGRVFSLAAEGRTKLSVYAQFRPYLALPNQRFLLGGNSEFQLLYVDHIMTPWFHFSDDSYIKYPIPGRGGDSHGQARGPACFRLKPGCMYLEGLAGYEAAIRAHYFALISMAGGHWLYGKPSHQDIVIEQTTADTPGYVLLTRAGGAPTWIYARDYRHLPATAHKTTATAQPAPAHHESGARTVLPTLAVAPAPSAMYLAALLLLVGAVAWQRHRRSFGTHPDSRMATRVPARGTAVSAGYPAAGLDSRPARSTRGARGPRPPNHLKALQARAVLPLAGPRLVAVVGCTLGAGQTVTTLMLADMLASLRGEPVAALDLNPGPTSLRELARLPAAPASTVLAGRPPRAVVAHVGHDGHPARPGGPERGSRGRGHFDVICQDSAGMADETMTSLQHGGLLDSLASRYPLTLADPGASELAKILAAADQLVLVVPANTDAAEAVSMMGKWLGAHGHGALAAHSIAVINGVSQRSVRHAEQAELVLRRRCRAIVRVPWDDHLAGPATGLGIRDSLQAPPAPSRLDRLTPAVPQAYTALAAVLVSALVVSPA